LCEKRQYRVKFSDSACCAPGGSSREFLSQASPITYHRKFRIYGRGGGVGRGRRVGRGLGVTLGVAVGVTLGEGLIVGVGVAVEVGVAVGVGVMVGVDVGVAVGVRVAVGVGVGDPRWHLKSIYFVIGTEVDSTASNHPGIPLTRAAHLLVRPATGENGGTCITIVAIQLSIALHIDNPTIALLVPSVVVTQGEPRPP
jgi:hypothetical protein